MSDTASVRVKISTRDLLVQLGAARHQSVDQVILTAVSAMQRDDRREIAAAEALVIRDDPADRADVRAVHQDIAALLVR